MAIKHEEFGSVLKDQDNKYNWVARNPAKLRNKITYLPQKNRP